MIFFMKNRIKEIRENKCIKQTELAHITWLLVGDICHLEKGSRTYEFYFYSYKDKYFFSNLEEIARQRMPREIETEYTIEQKYPKEVIDDLIEYIKIDIRF